MKYVVEILPENHSVLEKIGTIVNHDDYLKNVCFFESELSLSELSKVKEIMKIDIARTGTLNV